MTYTTTLRAIRAGRPCEDGWQILLAALGKTKADDEPLDLLTVLDSNGLDDTLWVLDETQCAPMLSRLVAADYAESVLHIFERDYPGDARPRDAIAVARDPHSTARERVAAGGGAWDASGVAARAAERSATGAGWVARDAARDAARAAARAAEGTAGAAGAAWGGARDDQERILRRYLTGETTEKPESAA